LNDYFAADVVQAGKATVAVKVRGVAGVVEAAKGGVAGINLARDLAATASAQSAGTRNPM
jgi:hypothetical protein